MLEQVLVDMTTNLIEAQKLTYSADVRDPTERALMFATLAQSQALALMLYHVSAISEALEAQSKADPSPNGDSETIPDWPYGDVVYTENYILATLERMQQKPCHTLIPGLLPFLGELGIEPAKLEKFKR